MSFIYQNANLTQLKENFMSTEEIEKNKLKEEFEENIKQLKELLVAEYIEKEKELRYIHNSTHNLIH